MSHHCHSDETSQSHCHNPEQHDEEHHKKHHEGDAHSHHHHHHDAGVHHHEERLHHTNSNCHKHGDDEMMRNVKLYYFDTRGRAELIRYILSYARVPFEDIRFTKEEWPELKKKFPAQQVPALEFEHNGRTVILSQSLSISRFVAKCFHLNGSDCIESAQCDEVVDCLNDLINLAVLAFLEQDYHRRELIKARLKDEEYPRILGYLETKLVANGGKYIIGSKMSYADLAIACFLSGIYKRGADVERIEHAYPTVCKLWHHIEEIPEIIEWLAKHPETEM